MNPGHPSRDVPPPQVIPLENLRANIDGNTAACTGMNADEKGTHGTHFSNIFSHAGKNISGQKRNIFCTSTEKVWEKRVPSVPGPPELESVVHALDYGHPRFREPGNGEWVVGLYRSEDGNAAPLLLWMDTREDRFWDAARREHVKPPAWYLRLAEQPQIDAETGYPIINGAVCPF